MNLFVGMTIAVMLGFAGLTAFREVRLYRKALKGEVQYLVSKRRLIRRLSVSLLLPTVAAFLFIGFFIFNRMDPGKALVFWTPPLFLMLIVVYLGMLDFRETRRDIDRIFLEAYRAAVKKAAEAQTRSENLPHGQENTKHQ